MNGKRGFTLFLLVCCMITQGAAQTGIQKIQHIVFILKENRTFDNFFGTFPGANGATTGKVSNGSVITLSHMPDRVRDMGHSWNDSVTAIDGGRMDKFDLVNLGNVNGDYQSMSQFYQSDIPNYWAYAQAFTLSDNTFSSLESGSFPNHLYVVGGQSGGVINNPVDPTHPQHQIWGCDSVPLTTVQVMDVTGKITTPFPCFDFQTIADELQTAGISWKFYAPGQGEIDYNYSAFDAISHIRNGPLWTTNVVPYTQFLTDAQNGTLPSVSWLIAGNGLGEHPANSVCSGENWTVWLPSPFVRKTRPVPSKFTRPK